MQIDTNSPMYNYCIERRDKMIYLTGDTHNDFSKLSNKSLKKHDLKIAEDDYILDE